MKICHSFTSKYFEIASISGDSNSSGISNSLIVVSILYSASLYLFLNNVNRAPNWTFLCSLFLDKANLLILISSYSQYDSIFCSFLLNSPIS